MQKTPFDVLLNEAATFKARLTADEHVAALEQRLHASMAHFDIDRPELLDSHCKGVGIYYIEAKFPFQMHEELERFGNRWGRIRGSDLPQAMPRYYPKRGSKHKESLAAGKYIPFYLGKRTEVHDRLTGHIMGAKDSKTYSLKLKSRPEVIQGIRFRFGFLSIPVDKDGYFCVSLLEQAIRDRIHPIIGKQ